MGKNGKEIDEQEFNDLNEDNNDIVNEEDDFAEELDFDNPFKNSLSDIDEDEE
jgi:hypothetical protein